MHTICKKRRRQIRRKIQIQIENYRNRVESIYEQKWMRATSISHKNSLYLFIFLLQSLQKILSWGVSEKHFLELMTVRFASFFTCACACIETINYRVHLSQEMKKEKTHER